VVARGEGVASGCMEGQERITFGAWHLGSPTVASPHPKLPSRRPHTTTTLRPNEVPHPAVYSAKRRRVRRRPRSKRKQASSLRHTGPGGDGIQLTRGGCGAARGKGGVVFSCLVALVRVGNVTGGSEGAPTLRGLKRRQLRAGRHGARCFLRGAHGPGAPQELRAAFEIKRQRSLVLSPCRFAQSRRANMLNTCQNQ